MTWFIVLVIIGFVVVFCGFVAEFTAVDDVDRKVCRIDSRLASMELEIKQLKEAALKPSHAETLLVADALAEAAHTIRETLGEG